MLNYTTFYDSSGNCTTTYWQEPDGSIYIYNINTDIVLELESLPLGTGSFGSVYTVKQHYLLDKNNQTLEPIATVKDRIIKLFYHENSYRYCLKEYSAVFHCARETLEPEPLFQYKNLEHNSCYALVMNKAPGVSLSKYLAQYPDLNLTERLKIFISIAKVVNQFLQNGLLHLDIKADNIILDKQANKYIVTLIDFGFSQPTRYAYCQDRAELENDQTSSSSTDKSWYSEQDILQENRGTRSARDSEYTWQSLTTGLDSMAYGKDYDSMSLLYGIAFPLFKVLPSGIHYFISKDDGDDNLARKAQYSRVSYIQDYDRQFMFAFLAVMQTWQIDRAPISWVIDESECILESLIHLDSIDGDIQGIVAEETFLSAKPLTDAELKNPLLSSSIKFNNIEGSNQETIEEKLFLPLSLLTDENLEQRILQLLKSLCHNKRTNEQNLATTLLIERVASYIFAIRLEEKISSGKDEKKLYSIIERCYDYFCAFKYFFSQHGEDLVNIFKTAGNGYQFLQHIYTQKTLQKKIPVEHRVIIEFVLMSSFEISKYTLHEAMSRIYSKNKNHRTLNHFLTLANRCLAAHLLEKPNGILIYNFYRNHILHAQYKLKRENVLISITGVISSVTDDRFDDTHKMFNNLVSKNTSHPPTVLDEYHDTILSKVLSINNILRYEKNANKRDLISKEIAAMARLITCSNLKRLKKVALLQIFLDCINTMIICHPKQGMRFSGAAIIYTTLYYYCGKDEHWLFRMRNWVSKGSVSKALLEMAPPQKQASDDNVAVSLQSLVDIFDISEVKACHENLLRHIANKPHASHIHALLESLDQKDNNDDKIAYLEQQIKTNEKLRPGSKWCEFNKANDDTILLLNTLLMSMKNHQQQFANTRLSSKASCSHSTHQ